jgi:hypothetical protein
MRASTPMTPGSWIRQPLSTLWKMGRLAGDYLAPPQMTLVPASTQFGRLEHDYGPLALLLTVSFRNESARPIWLHSLAIHDAGTWYQPMPFLGDRVHLISPQHQHDLPLPRTQSLITAPYIPASAVAERFALFRLPERWDRWPAHLQVTAKATFVRRRARRLVVTLTQPA